MILLVWMDVHVVLQIVFAASNWFHNSEFFNHKLF